MIKDAIIQLFAMGNNYKKKEQQLPDVPFGTITQKNDSL